MVRYQFTLKHESGDLTISEPIGWQEANFKLTRQDSHDIVFSYSSDLGFYGSGIGFDGGRDYIQNIVDLYGIDTILDIELYTAVGEMAAFEFQEIWTVNLEDYTLEDHKELGLVLYCQLEQKGFQSVFEKRFDSKVDLLRSDNLDGGDLMTYAPHRVTMHSREIKKDFEGLFEFDSIKFGGVDITDSRTRRLSIVVGWPVITDEINDFLTLGSGFQIDSQRINFFVAKEEGNFLIDINLNARLSIDRIIGDFDIVGWKWLFQKNEEPPIIINQRLDTQVSQYEEELTAVFNTTVSLKLGDKLYFYGAVDIDDVTRNLLGLFHFHPLIKFLAGSFMTMTGVTSIPTNRIDSHLIHDAFAKVCDSITGQNNSFYSEYLGHTSIPHRSYVADGEFSFYAVTNGASLRNLANRDVTTTFKDLYENLNAITPIGIGIEEIDGQKVVRLEHVSHFYDKATEMSFSNVANPVVKVAKNQYFKSIEIGYTKGLPEDVGGLNEPNVKKEYDTALKVVGEKKSILSKFIASGSLIEQQRREPADSKDSRYDNDLFIVSLNRTDITLTEKDEGYSLVSNVESSGSAYNLRLSPAMNLLRQGVLLNVGLIKKTGTKYKLVTNEGNFTMETTASHSDSGNFDQAILGEGDDILWNYAELPEVEPLFRPFTIEFTHPLSFEDFLILKTSEGRKKVISFEILGVQRSGWIIDLQYSQNDNTAQFTLIEANNIPIEVIDENQQFLLLEDTSLILLEEDNIGINI